MPWARQRCGHCGTSDEVVGCMSNATAQFQMSSGGRSAGRAAY
eukprot:CAMPEP_0119350412 /NCGR_PEP_ID=MMETSP1333-20130426/110046_1 /TAXON_ID=418940 /ORGANISM="Scyphosphaera apsteinii, Strain RCC1455" /LENGTH=42 /DNA_ID= /DNA_START= /DNA_END= /DNA_ORIENTATION=